MASLGAVGLTHMLLTALAFIWRGFACGGDAAPATTDFLDFIGGILVFDVSGCGAPAWVSILGFFVFVLPWVLAMAWLIFTGLSGLLANPFVGSVAGVAFLVLIAALIGLTIGL